MDESRHRRPRPRPERRRGGGQARRGPRNGNATSQANGTASSLAGSPPIFDMADDQSNAFAKTEPPRAPLTEAVPLDTPRFADLAGQNLIHPAILQTITEDLKFDHMMPVQAATLHQLLPPSRSDCLVQAKTGTGKTVAFLLPALQTLVGRGRSSGKDSRISLLVISPTRELAMQIAAEANSLLRRMSGFRVQLAIGGTNKDREEKLILGGCDVLVATPGRLLDHMSNDNVLYAFRQLQTLVLDEADRLLDMGFMKSLRDIIGRLPDKREVNRQSMLFSATIAPHVYQVAGLVLSDGYKFISTIPVGEVNTHQRVPQLLVKAPSFATVSASLVACVHEEASRHPGAFKAIVFAPTAALADLYGNILSSLAGLPPVSTLHSRMSQNKRTKITNDYRNAKLAILVATDVVARGIDFPGVTTIFQVGLPADKQSYIHRLGRTARADADGRGIFIISEAEAWFPKWKLKDIDLIPQDVDLRFATEVHGIVEKMEDSDRARIYQAWLGYYINHLKGFGWDKEQLVMYGNEYAHDGLAAPETPSIAKSTVGKMGLRGTRGLVVVPDPPRQRHNRAKGGG